MSGKKSATASDPMDQFAGRQASRLLGKLAFQVRHAAKRPNEEAIHDLRVSIRRLSQCLRELRQFFPRHRTRKILAQLAKMMDLAGETRNLDIAIELLGGAVLSKSAFAANLRKEREEAKHKLTAALIQWRRHDFSRKWRPWLGR